MVWLITNGEKKDLKKSNKKRQEDEEKDSAEQKIMADVVAMYKFVLYVLFIFDH